MPGPPVAFPGLGPLTINTVGSGSPGVVVNDTPGGTHGFVSYPLTVTGNNDVTSGNVAIADQAEQNTLNWLLWRAPDWITGGDYSSLFTGSVTIGNLLIIKGGGLLFENTSLLTIQSGCALTAQSGSFVTLAGTNTITGPTTISGALTMSGAETVTGSTTYSGNTAWRADRVDTVNPSVTIADATQFDVIYCTNCSFTVSSSTFSNPVTLANPANGTPVGIRVRVCVPGNDIVTTTSNATNGMLEVISNGVTTAVVVTFDGTTGNVRYPAFVDYMVVSTGGSSRIWAPIASSTHI